VPEAFDWHCRAAYYVYVACFGVVILPLSFLNLGEQSALQIIVAVFRFVAVSIIVATTLGAMYSQPYTQVRHPLTPSLPSSQYSVY